MNDMPGSVLIAAGSAENIPAALKLLEENGIETAGNPDVYMREYRSFGIDDAQELRQRASGRAIGKRRAFLIVAGGITSEAQNALLKTLEEPPGDALFLFIIPAPLSLLPTVRSRAHIIMLEGGKAGSPGFDAAAFLKANPAKRLDMLKPILEKDDDDKYDVAAILAFLASVETAAARIKDESAMKEVLEAVYRARGYATDRGALVKGLLESVALLSPVV